MSFVDQFMMCHSGYKYYCEPDEIRLPSVTEESKKEFYRIDMAQMMWNLLERKQNDFRS